MEKRTQTILIVILCAVLVIALALLVTHKPNASQSASQAAATTTPGIPGDNLALGENKDATFGTYLVGYNGMPVYTYNQDTSKVSYCVGVCATVWKPYVVTSTSTLQAESPISGTIAWLTRDDGSTQLTYNGQPLYFYSYDATSTIKGVGIRTGWTLAQP